jgi:flagellar basal-body rod protein FlgF|nr:MAG: flagellar basal-body rod protein FlgF [Bacteroidota bacterium]
MLDRIRNATQAMSLLMRRQEHLAHQLANLQTAGYKRDRLFQELLDETLVEDLTYQSEIRVGQWLEMAQGLLEHTGGMLDLALEGPGWFVLEQGGERFYTRDGRFSIDASGFLRTISGAFVLGQAGPIRIPEADQRAGLRIDPDGSLWSGERMLDRIQVVRFSRPDRLQKVGASLLRAPEDMPPESDRQSVLRQGYLERSNVDPLRVMTELIAVHRLFEFQQRALMNTDGLLSRVATEMARL